MSELSFCLSAFAMYSCPEAPPEAFPPISHKHDQPKERRRGQGREAPEGLGLDHAAAFGNVLWFDGPEGKTEGCPARARKILSHPEKIGVDFRGEFIAMLIYSIVFIYKNMKNLMLMKMQDAEKTWELLRGQAGQSTVLRTTGYSIDEKISPEYRDANATTVEMEDRVVLRDLQEQIEGEAHFIFNGQIVRGDMFFANPPLKNAQLRIPQLLQISQEASHASAL